MSCFDVRMLSVRLGGRSKLMLRRGVRSDAERGGSFIGCISKYFCVWKYVKYD